MARNRFADCAATLGFLRFAVPALIRHNFCPLEVLGGIPLHRPGEHSISSQALVAITLTFNGKQRSKCAWFGWEYPLKSAACCLCTLSPETQARF